MYEDDGNRALYGPLIQCTLRGVTEDKMIFGTAIRKICPLSMNRYMYVRHFEGISFVAWRGVA